MHFRAVAFEDGVDRECFRDFSSVAVDIDVDNVDVQSVYGGLKAASGYFSFIVAYFLM